MMSGSSRETEERENELPEQAEAIHEKFPLEGQLTEPDLKESPSEARSSSAKNFDSQESFAWIWALQMFQRFTPEMAVKQHELLHSVPQHSRT